MVPTLRHVSWTRFWVPRNGLIYRDPGGYLADPEGQHGKSFNPSAETLTSLMVRPCLALLGEPGIGKSNTLRTYLDARARSSENEDILRANLALGHDLERDIADTPEFSRWVAGQTTLHLFLDSLDEYPDGGASKVALWLLRKLERGPIAHLRLRLACRTAEWPRALDEHFPRIWKGKDDVGFYELAPLRRKDVELAAGVAAPGFLYEVERCHAVALAIKPITLGFLLEEYQRTRTLPTKRSELYERGCRILCEEPSETRQDAEHTGKLDATDRLAIAARIAAVTMLGRRSMIWRGPERGDTPHEAILERDLYGGTERGAIRELSVGAAEVSEVFTITGLFTARGATGFGWAHQTYAEFLAAWFLKNRRLSVDEMLAEITNPRTPGKVVPELHEVAAWLAGMVPEFFEMLIQNDPEVLLRSDFAKVSDVEREKLVSTLLDMLDKKQILDERFWDHRTCRNLAHARLAEQLHPYIVDRSKYLMARRTAIGIAEACHAVVLQSALVDVALDANDDAHIRSRAAHAVNRIGDQTAKQRFRPLVFGQYGPDPEDDLKGCAMEALWPEHLTTDELFANLSPPQRPNYYGAYQIFISHHLPERLRTIDLPCALTWTTSLPARHADVSIYAFNSLMESVFERAWRQIDAADILPAFALAVRARLVCHDGIFGYRHRETNNSAMLLADDRRRRILLTGLLDLPPINYEATALVLDGLVFPKDVPWTIERLKSTTVSDTRVRWARILTELCFFHRDANVADIIVAAREGINELGEALRNSLHIREIREALWKSLHGRSTETDLSLVDELRRAELEETERHEKLRNSLTERQQTHYELPPVAEHIVSCLTRFETGDIQAGWELHYWMTIDPEGKANESEYETDLTRLPGWKHAEPSVRGRILDAGRSYLFKASADPEKWLSQNMVYWPAVAGCRYLHLLATLEPGWVDALPPDVWRRWAAILVDLHEERAEALRRKLVANAYRADPPSVLEALRLVFQKESQSSECPVVLRRMADCWDERLGRFVLEFARSFDLKPRYWGELLDELLDHDVPGTSEYVASFLTSPIASEGPTRDRARAAAHALIVHTRDYGWRVIWPIVRDDPSFGREVFLGVVFSLPILGNKSWGDSLSESEAAELCLWLEDQFPRREDPKNQQPGRLSAVTARQRVGELRNAVVNNIVMRGTREAVAAIERISKAVPDLDWTVDLVRVRQSMVQGTWTPRSVSEILALQPHATAAVAVTQGLRTQTATQFDDLVLFSWLHLSDIHFGHKDVSHRWEQALVLDALRKDIVEHNTRDVPTPGAILITGDIAFGGASAQYELAKSWLFDLANLLQIDPSRVFLVPGNHDVDRSVDEAKRVARLLNSLRDGREDLDTILDDPDERAVLAARFAPYLSFASAFPSIQTPDPLFWSHAFTTTTGFRVRLVGLNTALLSANDQDKGKLLLGKQPLAQTLAGLPDGELVLILTHHPFREGWLADQRNADTWVRRLGRVHLFGHVHESDSEEARSGAGTSFLRIAAGAVHGDKLPPGVPASHGYSIAAVVSTDDGTLRLRVWPRCWSEQKKSFTVDMHNTPEHRRYAEHGLPGLRAPSGVPRPRESGGKK